MSSHRDIGNLGEVSFEKWCHEVGMIPNGSKIDKTGWDYHVEYPYEDKRDPDQIHFSPHECRVQVKSTDSRKGSVQIKLSNLMRTCTSLCPAFVLSIEFDKKNDAQRIYLIHMDDAWVTKVLKRVHDLNQSKPERKLNKSWMNVKYSDEHLISENTGKALQKAIQSYIGEDYQEYIKKKSLHLKTTGFEDGSGKITFTTSGEKNIQAIIDSTIGVGGSKIPITKIKGFKTRFGISATKPFLDFDEAHIEFNHPNPQLEGRIAFRHGKYGKTVELACRLHVGGMNPIFPRELQRFRVVSKLFELICHPATGSTTCNFAFGDDSAISLMELKKLLQVGECLADEDSDVYSEIRIQGKPPLGFNVKGNRKFEVPDILSFTLGDALSLLRYFDLDEDIQVTIPQLIDNHEALNIVHQLLHLTPQEISVESNTSKPGVFEEGEACGFIRTIQIQLGEVKIVFQLVLFGKIKQLSDDRYRLIPDSREVESPVFLDKLECLDENYIENTISEIEAKHPDIKFLIVND